jgi:hypothetical protein
MRFARLIATLLVGCTSLTACAEETRRPPEIAARPVSFALDSEGPKAVGQLAHLGSLRLTSPDSDFGGISGLIVSPDGKAFLAITDSSHWLTGKLTYTDGRLTGLTGKEIAPLRDLSGKPLQGKAGDAEGLAGSLDGDVYVSFEGDHRIWKYAFGKDGLDAKPVAVKVPADLAKAPGNGGLEAITLLSDGKLLAITESYENADGDIRGWLIDPAGKAAASLALKRRAPYDVTDARQLENGDVLTLERRFNRVGGVGFAFIKGQPAIIYYSYESISIAFVAYKNGESIWIAMPNFPRSRRRTTFYLFLFHFLCSLAVKTFKTQNSILATEALGLLRLYSSLNS